MVKFLLFWKMLGNVGKRLFYRGETKVSFLLFGAMHHAMIDAVADTFDGNFEQGLDMIIKLVEPLSEEMLSTLLFETSILGVKFKSLMTKFRDVKDFIYILDMAIYSIFGKWTKKVFSNAIYIPAISATEKVDTYILLLKTCPFCYPTMIPPEKLGKHRFGKSLTKTVEQMIQLSHNFLGNDFEVIARETQCFHQGDPYGEIRIWLYPRDKPQLKELNDYLKQIK